MSTKNLPPVQHLPKWPRVGLLGKSCSPRRLPPTLLPPLTVTPVPAGGGRVAGRAAEVSGHSDMDPRVDSLQKNIQFLQQQHKDTLEKLHAEIEHLRRENKELQYKLIMEPPKMSRRAQSRRSFRPPTQGSEAHAGLYLEEPLQDLRSSHDRAISNGGSSESSTSARVDHGPEVTGGLITSLQPFRIHSGSSHPPRAPTLQECEVIIRQLYIANSFQSQEIMRVKALLRDIVLSKKITPENFILTKAYLVDGTCKSVEEKLLPKVGLQTFPEKVSEPSKSGVILPALKPHLTSTIVERQRRTRAVQSNRLKRTVP